MAAVPGLLVKSGPRGCRRSRWPTAARPRSRSRTARPGPCPAVTVALLRLARRGRARAGPMRRWTGSPRPGARRRPAGRRDPGGTLPARNRAGPGPPHSVRSGCRTRPGSGCLLRACNCKHTVVHWTVSPVQRRLHRGVHPRAAEQAKISLRQLASAAGVSNPYLSQIERGLRRPSAEILQQIAKGLRISAEALYVQAGILEDRRPDSGVRARCSPTRSSPSGRSRCCWRSTSRSAGKPRLNAEDAEAAAVAAEAAAAPARALQATGGPRRGARRAARRARAAEGAWEQARSSAGTRTR